MPSRGLTSLFNSCFNDYSPISIRLQQESHAGFFVSLGQLFSDPEFPALTTLAKFSNIEDGIASLCDTKGNYLPCPLGIVKQDVICEMCLF